MLKLSNETFVNLGHSLKESARELERYLFEYYFEEGSSENVERKRLIIIPMLHGGISMKMKA